MTNNLRFSCPVCGFDRLTAPPYDEFNCATFEICPSCGTEFGYDDANVSVAILRQNWIEKGMPWFSQNTPKPMDWDPFDQLKNV